MTYAPLKHAATTEKAAADKDEHRKSNHGPARNGQVIAESEDTVLVEGNHYFPRSSVRGDVLRESSHRSRCPWKGLASYFTLEVDGATNPDAAWHYPELCEAAKEIAGHVSFWQCVEVR